MRNILLIGTILAMFLLSPGASSGKARSFRDSTPLSHTVMGRVTNDKGRPISNARLILTDANVVSRVAYSSTFGYYRFDNVPSGDLYVLNVNHKSYLFATPSHVIEIIEDKLFDFVGEINSSRGPK